MTAPSHRRYVQVAPSHQVSTNRLQAPLSPIALPFIPGQWDTVYVPNVPETTPVITRATLFTTFAKVAPTITNIRALFNVAWRVIDRYTRRQQILAEPIYRSDGARKKILLDAGLQEEQLVTTKPKQNARAPRRAEGMSSPPVIDTPKPSKHKGPELWVRPSPATDYPKLWLDDDPHRPSPQPINYNSNYKYDLPSKRKPAEPAPKVSKYRPARKTRRAARNAQSSQEARPSQAHRTPQSPHSSQTPQALHTPPKQTITPVSDLTPLSNGESPLHSTPLVSKRPVLRQDPVSPPHPISHRRILELQNGSPAKHTKPVFLANAGTEYTPNKYLKSVALKHKTTENTANSRNANDAYIAEHKVKAQITEEAEAQAQKIIDEYYKDRIDPLLGTDEYSFLSSFSEGAAELSIANDNEDIHTASEYSGDMSFLPDAPSPPLRKSCQWTKQSRVKKFYRDTQLDDMLDSTLEDIIFSPEKKLEEMPQDESSFSIEILQEIRNLQIAPQQKQQGPVPAPQPITQPTPPIQKPLVGPLQKDELKKLDDVIKMTSSGQIQMDVVKGKLSTHDLKTLLPTAFNGSPIGWLNDAVINEYLSLLVEHEKSKAGYKHRRGGPAPPVHAFASQWYQSASNNIKSIERWASRKQLGGKNLLDANLILIPVCSGSHWRLAVIKPKAKSVEILDSMHWGVDDIANTVQDWLKQELGDLYIEEDWSVLRAHRSMKQMNGSDCGVFTCLNALAALRGVDFDQVVAVNGMKEARCRIAVDLLLSKVSLE